MAISKWKELLHPGTYRLPDNRVVTYRRADAVNAARVGNRMLAAGLRVPFCWEHDPKADPVRATTAPPHSTAWLSQGYAGEVAEYAAGPDGVLRARLRCDDAGDAAQAAKVGTVSPRLNYDFVDEQGVLWPGISVGHVAATPLPVQRRQDRVEFSRSRVTATVVPLRRGSARDSHDLSLATLLGAASMADEDKTGAAGGEVAELIKALKGLGVNTGEPKNLGELIVAVKAIAAHKGGPDEELAGDGPEAEGGGSAEAGPAPPAVMMSWLVKRAKLDAGELDARIERLFTTGRVDGKTRDRLRGELKSANLSHASYSADTFELKPLALVTKVEALELNRRGANGIDVERKGGKPADLSRVAPVPRPAGLVGPDRSADEEEARLEMRAHAGAPAAVK